MMKSVPFFMSSETAWTQSQLINHMQDRDAIYSDARCPEVLLHGELRVEAHQIPFCDQVYPDRIGGFPVGNNIRAPVS